MARAPRRSRVIDCGHAVVTRSRGRRGRRRAVERAIDRACRSTARERAMRGRRGGGARAAGAISGRTARALAALAFVASSSSSSIGVRAVTYDAISATYGLTTDCTAGDSLTATKSSVVTCGPSTCTVKVSTAKCSAQTATDIAAALSATENVKCGASCTAATSTTDFRCSSEWMAANLGGSRDGGDGVVAAWCTDKYFVVVGSMASGYEMNMDDIPQPPGGTDRVSSTACVTGDATVSSVRLEVNAFPLIGTYSLLSTAAASNNMASFPNGAQAVGSSDVGTYFNNAGFGAFGLPADSGIGITVFGQSIYPTYSNTGQVTLDSCEVDSCNEHVGQGGGQPHLHGDPFSATDGKCLYSPQNYTNSAGNQDNTVHPPLIGFSYDGPMIYGRYLDVTAPGFSTGLDACGGHEHDDYDYHYHPQIFQATTTSMHKGTEAVKNSPYVTYPAFTPGPSDCWRGDISTDNVFWTKKDDKDLMAICSGTTEYYLKDGYSFPSTSCVVESSSDTTATATSGVASLALGALSTLVAAAALCA